MPNEPIEKVLEAASAYAHAPAEERSAAQPDEIEAAARSDPAVLNEALHRLRSEQKPDDWKDVVDALVAAAKRAGHDVTAAPGFYIRPRRG